MPAVILAMMREDFTAISTEEFQGFNGFGTLVCEQEQRKGFDGFSSHYSNSRVTSFLQTVFFKQLPLSTIYTKQPIFCPLKMPNAVFLTISQK